MTKDEILESLKNVCLSLPEAIMVAEEAKLSSQYADQRVLDLRTKKAYLEKQLASAEGC